MNNTLVKSESTKNIINKSNLRHIAVIMDGNRRWARARNLPSMSGHKEGVKALKRTIKAANDFGIKYLTVYAFSTENWGRKQEEVEFLMKLLNNVVKGVLNELNENNVKIRIIGDLQSLGKDLKNTLKTAQELTGDNSGLNLQIALNYGARNEITNAVKHIFNDIKAGKITNPEQITEELIENNLYTAGIPNPDLLIRTGGENRISNYLLWQLAYTEMYITETFWPDFDEEALSKAIIAFAERNRRFGRD